MPFTRYEEFYFQQRTQASLSHASAPFWSYKCSASHERASFWHKIPRESRRQKMGIIHALLLCSVKFVQNGMVKNGKQIEIRISVGDAFSFYLLASWSLVVWLVYVRGRTEATWSACGVHAICHWDGKRHAWKLAIRVSATHVAGGRLELSVVRGFSTI